MKIKDKLYPNGSPYENAEILPYDTQHFLNYPTALVQGIQTILPKRIIEVGSWKGHSANYMAKVCLQYTDNFEIVCIDTFLGSAEHYTHPDHSKGLPRKNNLTNLLSTFLSNTIQENNTKYITPFPVDSNTGFLVLKEWGYLADLIYIDGSHDYRSVTIDIMNYRQLVRRGGVMIFDDYLHPPTGYAIDDNLSGGQVIDGKYFWVNN